ncbi:MAG: helix-turn-helix transcriptional regulator [Planctomycetota bacterium]
MTISSRGLRFLHGSHRPQCVASVDKRFDYHTLQLMTAGAIELSYGGDRYRLEGGWSWPAYPGPHIRFHEHPAGRPWNHRYIAFEGGPVPVWEARGLLQKAPVAIDDAEQLDGLAARFDGLLAHATSYSRFDHLRAVNELERLLIELAELSQTAPHLSSGWMEAVLAEIQDWQQDPDYDALAERLGMSTTTLRRKFQQATGLSLHAFRIQHRVTTARQMLGETDDSIKSIAHRLGYNDVHYFTRQFTQAAGISPGRFRDTRQA